MATTVYIKDKEQRFISFGRYGWDGQALGGLRKAFNAAKEAGAENASPSRFGIVDNFLKRLDGWAALSAFTDRSLYSYTLIQPGARWLLLPARAETQSSEMHKIKGDAAQALACVEEANWAAKARAEVNKAIRGLRSDGLLSEDQALQGQITDNPFASVVSRVRASGLSIHNLSAATRLGQDEAFACFFPSDNGYFAVAGTYYSSKNPLARAQTFESEKAAQIAMARRGFNPKTFVIVRIECRASAVSNPHGIDIGQLGEAMSLAESQALEHALESAQIERLRERLNELEALSGAHATPASAPKRARSGL